MQERSDVFRWQNRPILDVSGSLRSSNRAVSPGVTRNVSKVFQQLSRRRSWNNMAATNRDDDAGARCGAKSAAAEPAVLMGFVNSGTRLAVQRAVDGATRRLTLSECQRVFGDFSFAVPAPDHFAYVRFVDDSMRHNARRGSTLVFTQPGGRVVHVCGNQFQGQIPVRPHKGRDHRDPRAAPRARAWRKPPTSDANHRASHGAMRAMSGWLLQTPLELVVEVNAAG
jgi:hypothetical protein